LSSQTLIHFYADNSSIVNKLIILEMSNGLNQSHIRDIVSQVKSGLKTKTEAFNELKSILQASNKKLEPTTTDDDLIDESDKNIAGGRFSQEDRRLLINKLIEKKRLGRGGKNDLLPDTPEYDDNQPDLPSEMKSRMYSDSYRDDMLNNSRGDESYTARQSRSVNNYPPGRPESRGRSTSTRAVTPKERSRSASQSQRRDSYDVNNIYENSENYINRIAQSEAMVREEMFRDFTFKPKIKQLPASYGVPKDKDLPFHDRVTKWQKEREVETSRRKEINSNSELLDCTFKPKINRASVKAVKEIRGEQSEPVNERLFKTNDLLQSQRSKFIEEQLRLERQSEEQECTFKPNLSTKKKLFSFVQSKYKKQPLNKSVDDQTLQTSSEYTFTPKVRGVGRSMSAAKLYIK